MRDIRVLVVEDSAVMRRALKDIIESAPGLTIIDTARDGDEGVEKARRLRPDVVTMDVNLPGMDGITAMQIILNENICPVLIISSFTGDGDVTTFEALELGAFDCILKPVSSEKGALVESRDQIIRKVRAAAGTGTLDRIRKRLKHHTALSSQPAIPVLPGRVPVRPRAPEPVTPRIAVAIGVSTGGPGLVSDIMAQLPPRLGAALFIVQHMPERFTGPFAARLDSIAGFPVHEAGQNMQVFDGCAYLAKGGSHLQLHRKKDGSIMIRLSQYPDHMFRPSVDVMMDSVVSVFGRNTVGVLLTGMGDDGAFGMKLIHDEGGYTIAESEETAVVFGMPRAAIEAGVVTEKAPAYRMAETIVSAIAVINERMEKVHGREESPRGS